MKWLDDPPRYWADAPRDPPAAHADAVELEADADEGGVVVTESGGDGDEAYIYAAEDEQFLEARR